MKRIRPGRPHHWIRGHPRLERVHDFFSREVWRIDRSRMPALRALPLRWLRVVLLAANGFSQDRCMMRAGALTYITIFSLVPLLAFGFSMAKGFGADNYLRERVIDPFLDEAFPEVEQAPDPDAAGAAAAAPEGPSTSFRLREAVDQVFDLVERTNLKGLGAFGLVFLLYSIVKLLGAMERTMNEVWGVQSTRSLARRVSNYVSLVVLTPIVMITGAAVTAALQGGDEGRAVTQAGLQTSEVWFLKLVPFVLVWLAMTYLNLAMPNTRVRLASAVIGGVVAGTMWQFAQILHIELQVGMTRFNAIYAGFAAIPVFFLWIYINWVALLIGVVVTFAHQNESHYAELARTGRLDQAARERLALRLVGRIVAAFIDGKPPPDAAELAGDLGIAPRVASDVLERVAQRNLLLRTHASGDVVGFVPARDPDSITVLELLDSLRRDDPGSSLPVKSALDERSDRLLADMDAKVSAAFGSLSLSDISREPAIGREEDLDVETKKQPG